MSDYLINFGWKEQDIVDALNEAGQAGVSLQVDAVVTRLNQIMDSHDVLTGFVKQAIRDVGVVHLSRIAPPLQRKKGT